MAIGGATDAYVLDDRTSHRLAGPWARYFARGVDTVIFTLPSFLLSVLVLGYFFDLRHLAGLGHLGFYTLSSALTAVGASAIIAVILAAVMAQFGATPGKRLFGIRVQPLATNAGFFFYLRREFILQLIGLAALIPWIGLLVPFVFNILQYLRVKAGRAVIYDVGRAQVLGIRISSMRGILAGLTLFFLVAVTILIYLYILRSHPDALDIFQLPTKITPDIAADPRRA